MGYENQEPDGQENEVVSELKKQVLWSLFFAATGLILHLADIGYVLDEETQKYIVYAVAFPPLANLFVKILYQAIQYINVDGDIQRLDEVRDNFQRMLPGLIMSGFIDISTAVILYNMQAGG